MARILARSRTARTRTSTAAALLLAVTLAAFSGCGPSKADIAAAQEMEHLLGQYDAVESAEVDPVRHVSLGSYNSVTVTMATDATPAQIAAVLGDIETTADAAGLDRENDATIRLANIEGARIDRRGYHLEDPAPPSVVAARFREAVDLVLPAAAWLTIDGKGFVDIGAREVDHVDDVAGIISRLPNASTWDNVRVRAGGYRAQLVADGAPYTGELIAAYVDAWHQVTAANEITAIQVSLHARPGSPYLDVEIADRIDSTTDDFSYATHQATHWPLAARLIEISQRLEPSGDLRIRRKGSDHAAGTLAEITAGAVAPVPHAPGWDDATRAHLAGR